MKNEKCKMIKRIFPPSSKILIFVQTSKDTTVFNSTAG